MEILVGAIGFVGGVVVGFAVASHISEIKAEALNAVEDAVVALKKQVAALVAKV